MLNGILALVLAILVVVPARAQEVTASVSTYAPFRWCCDTRFPSAVELRVAIPLSERFALEPLLTVGSQRSLRGNAAEGMFGLQLLHRTPLRWRHARVFATYGGAVYHENFKVTLVGPGDNDVIPLVLGHVGMGVHWWLTERLAARPEVQVVTLGVFPMGARVIAGVSVKIGH